MLLLDLNLHSIFKLLTGNVTHVVDLWLSKFAFFLLSMSCIVHCQVYNVLSVLYLLHLQLMLGHCRKPDKVCDLQQQQFIGL